MELNLPSPLQELRDEVIEKAGIRLFIKRDDLIHSAISGNKWRKLKFNIQAFQQQKATTLVTFGGAFSNHIHATAAAGKLFNFPTVGIIRGEEHTPLNSTLQDAANWGMQLEYIDRATYRDKSTPEFLQTLKEKYHNCFIVPEGGANELGAKGCEEILTEITTPFDILCVACGTATTLSGILNASQPGQHILGVPVLKGGEFLNTEIQQLSYKTNYSLECDYHFNGYAKHTPELLSFIAEFEKKHNIQLDQVYTGKLFYALYDLMKNNKFKKGSTIIAIHTGGVQGKRGLTFPQ